eukprot:5403445-Heterocapsa_arctica.AAC.1
MEHDIGGSALTHYLAETKHRTDWGEAEQIAVFAHTNKISVEALGFGINPQYVDGTSGEHDILSLEPLE